MTEAPAASTAVQLGTSKKEIYTTELEVVEDDVK